VILTAGPLKLVDRRQTTQHSNIAQHSHGRWPYFGQNRHVRFQRVELLVAGDLFIGRSSTDHDRHLPAVGNTAEAHRTVKLHEDDGDTSAKGASNCRLAMDFAERTNSR